MQDDPARAEDVRAWLARARLDLEAGGFEMGNPALYFDVAFHAQQAVEKSFKAFLAWHDMPFPKTHDLERLGRACAQIAPSLGAVVDEAVPLTEYAWRFRYPGEVEGPGRAEAEAALATARRVYEAVLGQLPSGVRS